MSSRLTFLVVILTLVLLPWLALGSLPGAAEPQLLKGTVVSASAGRLVMKDTAGKEQSFSVDQTAKITINGNMGKLEDLQETMPIQVTTDEKGKVLAVSTIDKDKHFIVTHSPLTIHVLI